VDPISPTGPAPTDEVDRMMVEAVARMRSAFKIPAFRRGQEQVIRSILAGRDTLAVMSTGFCTLAVEGRKAARAAFVSGDRSTTVSPVPSHASAARIPGPPAFVTIARRVPFGSGCVSTKTPVRIWVGATQRHREKRCFLFSLLVRALSTPIEGTRG
jgi:hypothetical protein